MKILGYILLFPFLLFIILVSLKIIVDKNQIETDFNAIFVLGLVIVLALYGVMFIFI